MDFALDTRVLLELRELGANTVDLRSAVAVSLNGTSRFARKARRKGEARIRAPQRSSSRVVMVICSSRR